MRMRNVIGKSGNIRNRIVSSKSSTTHEFTVDPKTMDVQEDENQTDTIFMPACNACESEARISNLVMCFSVSLFCVYEDPSLPLSILVRLKQYSFRKSLTSSCASRSYIGSAFHESIRSYTIPISLSYRIEAITFAEQTTSHG